MPTPNGTRGSRDSDDGSGERQDTSSRPVSDTGAGRRAHTGNPEGQRRQGPSDTGQRRRTRSQDTGQGRRVSPSDTATRRRQSPSDTGRRRRTRPQDTASGRRVPPSDTASGRRVSPSDTASRRRQSPSVTSSRPRTSPGHTGSVALVSDTGSFRRQSWGDTGSYVDASLDGTTASIDTRKRRMRTRGARRAAPARAARGGAGAHAAHTHSSLSVVAIVVALVVVAAIGVGGYFLFRSITHPYEGAKVPDGEAVVVAIPEGSSGSEIIAMLLDAGVIHSTSDFMSAVKTQNADQSLRSGTYTFRTGSDPADVVRQLVQGPNSVEGQLQVPEGLTVRQLAALVEASLSIPADEFIEAAKASSYVDEYSCLREAANDSLEGFLYPKTYDFAGKDVNADTVIRSMLSQFETEMAGLDLDGARAGLLADYGLNVTNYDIIKIASIIEEEALSEDDRSKVSSVFYNRLADGMALQSDATMSYVTEGAVTSEDLTKDSPYNTYYYKGLPPTPICTPSKWAIEAAMYPADTDYLFFFIIESENYSNHTFSVTYEEHESAYAVALVEQREANERAESGQGEASETGAGDEATDVREETDE